MASIYPNLHHLVCGNLGHISDVVTRIYRAEQVLARMQLASNQIVGLCAPKEKGSTVEICLLGDKALKTNLCLYVKALGITFRELDGKNTQSYVWIDGKKTDKELRPSRMIARIVQCLRDLAPLGLIPRTSLAIAAHGALRFVTDWQCL